jgi:acetyltransferase-like isoleucine patch superfamily enzyme
MAYIKGNNVVIKENVIIGDNVIIEDDVYLDYGVIIRENVHIKKGTFIGARCILGEFMGDFFDDRVNKKHLLTIGENSLIRSETIIYGDCSIGDHFQTGHRVTIREKAGIGSHVRIGTLSDVQGDCIIGDYVNIHSNVHIGQKSNIHNYVWIFPYVVLTNDPNPPSESLFGVTIDEFSIIATGTIVLPGKRIGKDSLIGAGSVVTKHVMDEKVVMGNPAKEVCSIFDIKNKETGEAVYPWRYHFDRGMPWKGMPYEEWEELSIRPYGKENTLED